jgi:hypothetical protein
MRFADTELGGRIHGYANELCVITWESTRACRPQAVLADATPGFCPSAFFFSAQRFFTPTDRRFLAAALIPRFVVPVAAGDELSLADDFDLRAAHRAFIAADRRRLPAAVMPLPRLGAAASLVICRVGLAAAVPSARASIALSKRSRSRFSSETILYKSNSILLEDF